MKSKIQLTAKELSEIIDSKADLKGPTHLGTLSEDTVSAFSYTHNGDIYDYLYKPDKRKKLFVLFSGANNRGKVPLPIFQRWKWLSRFPGVVLNVADPSLRSDDDLTLAWYIGNGISDPAHVIAQTVRSVCTKNKIAMEDVILWGSSGGGFAALRCGALLPGSLSVSVNPQTSISKYFERHVEKMLGANFNGITIRRFTKKFPIINSVIGWIKAWNPDQNIIYAQNIRDGFHLRNHANEFAKAFGVPLKGGWNKKKTIEFITFDADNGHGPEPDSFFPLLLKNALTFKSRREAILGRQIKGTLIEQKIITEENRFPVSNFLISSKHHHIGRKGDSTKSRALEFSKTGAFKPRRDVPEYKLKFPIQWDMNPFTDANWCMQLHAFRCLAPLCMANSTRPNKSYIKTAFKYIMDWVDQNLEEGQGSFAWYDMSTGVRALYIAYCTQELQILSPNDPDIDLEILRSTFLVHANILASKETFSLNNHGFFQAHGLMALIKIAPTIGLDLSDLQEIPTIFFMELINQQFGEEGMHMEHSPDYHFFAENLVKQFIATGWYDSAESLTKKMEDVEIARNWLRNPLGLVHVIGDSNAGSSQPDVTAKALKGSKKNLNNRVIHLKRWAEAGYGFARTSPAVDINKAGALTLFAGHHDYAHKHADDLSITWIDNGKDILIDAGKYGYLSDKWRSYVVSTRAHNTVEIDGTSGPRAKKFAYSSALGKIGFTGNSVRMTAGLDRPDFDVRHDRVIEWAPGKSLTINDSLNRVKGSAKKDYVSWLHFAPDLELVEMQDRVEILRDGKVVGKVEYDPHMSVYRLERGNQDDLLGWYSPSYGKIEPCFTLGFRINAKSAKFGIKIILL